MRPVCLSTHISWISKHTDNVVQCHDNYTGSQELRSKHSASWPSFPNLNDLPSLLLYRSSFETTSFIWPWAGLTPASSSLRWRHDPVCCDCLVPSETLCECMLSWICTHTAGIRPGKSHQFYSPQKGAYAGRINTCDRYHGLQSGHTFAHADMLFLRRWLVEILSSSVPSLYADLP